MKTFSCSYSRPQLNSDGILLEKRHYSGTLNDSVNSLTNMDTNRINPKFYNTATPSMLYGSYTSLQRSRQPSANSLTNIGTGQYVSEEIKNLSRFQSDQRKKDASINDLEAIRYVKVS